ncbi:MAG: hypothetical protein RJB62_1186 [Pseudomonadota bacterium]|jgi:hypothetical protein
MNARTTFDNAEPLEFEASRLAYIKPVNADEARAMGIVPSDIVLPAGIKFYAIHTADGTPVALMDTWASAYGAAIQNNLTPVSLH